MFALEVAFQDGVSQPELILVRRSRFLVGGSETAQVTIDDMCTLDYQLEFVRDVGRKFVCRPQKSIDLDGARDLDEGSYEGTGVIDTGPVRLLATALDSDLRIRSGETPDKAGVRILRAALTESVPHFPAIAVRDEEEMVISFNVGQEILVGRSNKCTVRLLSLEISDEHARITFEEGTFWVEDLGSTNGTFVDGQQISGRTQVDPGTPIILGRATTILGVTSYDELAGASSLSEDLIPKPSAQRYPILVSMSEVARPARLVMPPNEPIAIGRNPVSDMWLGVPHVSRKHCELVLSEDGAVTLTDCSTNGTGYDDGILQKGQILEIKASARVIDFGGGVTVGVCFDESQEATFLAAQGALDAFTGTSSGLVISDNSLVDIVEEPAVGAQPEGVTPQSAWDPTPQRSETIFGPESGIIEEQGSIGLIAKMTLVLAVLGLMLVCFVLIGILWSLLV